MPTETYWTDKDTGKKHRLNGYERSTRLPEKEKLRQQFRDTMEFENEAELPKGGVDLRRSMPPIQDQSTIASCTANALGAIYAYLLRAGEETEEDVSRLFIYYNARLKKNLKQMKDCGSSITFTIEALEEHGACHTEFWPYELEKVNDEPNAEAYEKAKQNTITEAFQLNNDLLEMKSCLAQGLPFAFGITLFETFDQAKAKGVVTTPALHEAFRKKHPQHAMVVVGYIESKEVFIVRNSWGENWGDKGYCYIPYAYMLDKLRCYDLWTVRQLKAYDLGRKYWEEDEDWSPLTFSYEEEYERVETYHYEETVFEETETVTHHADGSEERCSVKSFRHVEHSSSTTYHSTRRGSTENVDDDLDESPSESEELSDENDDQIESE